MDKNFTSALHKAINNFGKDIVKEKRFVDVGCDYYLAIAVDHPTWKNVLTAFIVEGFGNEILSCNNAIHARIFIDKYSSSVSTKNRQVCQVLQLQVTALEFVNGYAGGAIWHSSINSRIIAL